MQSARELAHDFVTKQAQFQLGFLPTEQSNPRTASLSQTIAGDTAAGIRQLLRVDADMIAPLAAVLGGAAFSKLVDAMVASLESGGRVIFSGCGATGRLSILLDACWRHFWQRLAAEHPAVAAALPVAGMEQRTVSVMTGGDRALIRSVENFEDFQSFGRRQMVEAKVAARDTVVAITEGGETSSVIGSAWQAVEAGAAVFLAFNNPADLLSRHIERSRQIIEHPAVTVLDLCCGPMAVAGSTRMQATTSEQLVVGGALELALRRFLVKRLSAAQRSQIGLADDATAMLVAGFESLLSQLRQPAPVAALAELTNFEKDVYEAAGLVTYFGHDYLLDILTDTTERAPTFMLPPFRPGDDTISPPSWAFVKDLILPTPRAWAHLLRRPPAGLRWDSTVYRELGAPDTVCARPPALSNAEIMRFTVGCEDDPSRYQCEGPAAAVWVTVADEACGYAAEPLSRAWPSLSAKFALRGRLAVGAGPGDVGGDRVFHVAVDFPATLMGLFEHLGVKLVMNTVSTATMAKMGRVMGNWMVFAETTNKKLIDRATRLVQHFTHLPYEEACAALFETLEEIRSRQDPSRPPVPATVATIEKYRTLPRKPS